MHGAETQLELPDRPQSFNLDPSSVDHQKRHEPRRGRSARLENQFLRMAGAGAGAAPARAHSADRFRAVARAAEKMGGGKRSHFEDRLWYFKRGLGRKTVPLFPRGMNLPAEPTALQQATAAWLRCSFLHAQVGDGCHTFRASMADIDFETQVQKRRRRWTFSSSPPRELLPCFTTAFRRGGAPRSNTCLRILLQPGVRKSQCSVCLPEGVGMHTHAVPL